MLYRELAERARGKTGAWCKACPVCDGRACGAHVPGPGAKGTGTVAVRNYQAWEEWRVNLDTIRPYAEADTSLELFGRTLSLPVMVGPVGDVRRHYGELFDDVSYNRCVLSAAAAQGTVAWTGDGLAGSIVANATQVIASLGGCGVETIKPWAMDVVRERVGVALGAHPLAIAMDIDAAGLPFLKGQNPPAGSKTVDQLAEVAEQCHEAGTPFVLKGIMTARGALKALDAGADAIVVSNHGGRVLDGVPATAEVLPGIAEAVAGRMSVLVDGGIRSGVDVFRALALGADAALVCRPVVVAAHGGGQQGVEDYLAQLGSELADTMEMCGAATLADVGRGMLFS